MTERRIGGHYKVGAAMARALMETLQQNVYNAEEMPAEKSHPPAQQTNPKNNQRNSPCPCNSGLKWKKCCWNKQA